jgi:hypothetical protein
MRSLPSESFKQEFESHLDEFKARDKLNGLENSGCDPFFLLMYLELYCSFDEKTGDRARIDPSSGIPVQGHGKGRRATTELEKFVKSKRSLAVALENLAKRLAKDADEIERVNSEPEVSRALSRYAMPPVDLADNMREYISRLETASEAIERRWGRAFREDPGTILMFAADHIKTVTGKVQHAALALLVEVAYAARRKDKDCSADDVRKIVNGARKRWEIRSKRLANEPDFPPRARQ